MAPLPLLMNVSRNNYWLPLVWFRICALTKATYTNVQYLNLPTFSLIKIPQTVRKKSFCVVGVMAQMLFCWANCKLTKTLPVKTLRETRFVHRKTRNRTLHNAQPSWAPEGPHFPTSCSVPTEFSQKLRSCREAPARPLRFVGNWDSLVLAVLRPHVREEPELQVMRARGKVYFRICRTWCQRRPPRSTCSVDLREQFKKHN